jgi:PAS domain S-box-containing protein
VSAQESSPATATAEAVEELLRQLVDARFVLTDREGAVTRWSRPAEELFGWPAGRMLGRPLVETLALAGDLPQHGGVVQTVARRKDGTELELTLTLVPVGMSQSLEFNGFLEALEIAAPRGNALRQLQRSHKTVVDWVNAAMRGEAHLEDEDLAAGTIVAFRPLVELPPLVAPPEEDEEDPTSAATAVAAGQIADAVEAALGRSEDLERALEGTTAELEEARGQAEAARGEAAEAAARIGELGGELADTRRVLEEMRAQAEDERERTRAAVEETRGLVERLERELAGTPQAHERLSAQLEETRASVADLRAMREKVETLESELDRERDTRTRVEQLETALGEALAREPVSTADAAVQSELEERLSEALRRTETRVDELASGLTGATAERDERLRADLDAVRVKVESLTGERIEEHRVLAGDLADTHAKLEALERAVGDEHQRADEARALLGELRQELAQLRTMGGDAATGLLDGGTLSQDAVAAIERLTSRAEQAADAARTHSTRASDASGEAEARASRAEEAAAAAEAQARRAAESIESVEQRAARAEETLAAIESELASAQSAASAIDEQASRIETDIARAGEAAAAVERTIARADERAAAVERDAGRVESAAAQVQAAVQRSAEVAGEIEAKIARVEEQAAGAERQAERAETAVTAVERHLSRANEAAGNADRHASRAGEQAGAVEETARRLAEAAEAAEREAERAREAAASAANAAGVARQAADQAGAPGHGHAEERRMLSRFETHGSAQEQAPVSAGNDSNGHAGAPGEDPRRPLFANREQTPTREPRPGFDDVKQPKAKIGLDGRFQELNQAFSDLLGYTEAEFQQAVWPPVMDRPNLDKHRQQLKDMLEGSLESVEVNTGYVHAQGLLVPIVGRLTLVRENGEPAHLLLETS